ASGSPTTRSPRRRASAARSASRSGSTTATATCCTGVRTVLPGAGARCAGAYRPTARPVPRRGGVGRAAPWRRPRTPEVGHFHSGARCIRGAVLDFAAPPSCTRGIVTLLRTRRPTSPDSHHAAPAPEAVLPPHSFQTRAAGRDRAHPRRAPGNDVAPRAGAIDADPADAACPVQALRRDPDLPAR